MPYYTYILASKKYRTLYVDVTNDIARRAYEHRHSLLEGFTKKYRVKHLVYFEEHKEIRSAIQREKNIKHWSRAWKVKLMESMNTEWRDLYLDLNR